MTSRISSNGNQAQTRGSVKVTFAVTKDGKQQPGSCSVRVEDSTPQEARDYIVTACDRDAVLTEISDAAGKSVDELLTELAASHKVETAKA